MKLLLFLLLFQNAFAIEYSEAEHARISDDVEQLASRQLWAGVEKKYQELLAMELAAGQPILTFDDLVYGAYAARAMGHTLEVRDRLSRAVKLEAPYDRKKDVVDWLESIKANYGQVSLLAHNSRNAALSPSDMPMDPDQRAAVEGAMDAVRREATFQGLLPRGVYVFAGHTFKVEPGIAVSIEASPRLKKTTGEVVQMTTEPMVDPSSPSP